MKKYHYIYCIVNLKNQKLYIGRHSTNNINDGYFGSGEALRRAIKKHGRGTFAKDILEYCSSFEESLTREQFWIGMFKPKGKRCDWVYNMTDGGEGRLGSIVTFETRIRIGARSIGKNNGMFGKKHTNETKNKISKKAKGRKHKKESIEWMSLRKRGKMNKFYGKSHSLESKQKISIAKRMAVLQVSIDGKTVISKWESPSDVNSHFKTTAAYYWIYNKKIANGSRWLYEKDFKHIL